MRDIVWSAFIFFNIIFFASCANAEQNKTIHDNPINIDRFISPETCAGCHSKIFEQWENSMLNLSHKDPVYLRVAQYLREGLINNDEIEEAESCVKCHVPVGYLSGYPTKTSDSPSHIPEIAKNGIQCDYCHSVVSVTRLYNNGLVLKPGHGENDPGIKYGPYDDAMPDYHEAQYSELHTKSEFCGTCHDVKHVVFGTDIETTYTEWKNSPYNSKDPAKSISCQGCHMYQRPGFPGTGSVPRPENPGSATDYSIERPHISTHYFVGANSYIPELMGDKTKSLMAVERLQNAATLAVNREKTDKKQISVTIENTGAGHSIPTGVSNLRQVWLEITLKDKKNKTIFQMGVPDEKNELPENTIIFNTVFGDGKGGPVANIAKARQILSDNRIKAGESVTRLINLPFVPPKDSILTVRLLYRSMPAKLLNTIYDRTFDPLPIVEMAKVQIKI
jgi:hypothetical protein